MSEIVGLLYMGYSWMKDNWVFGCGCVGVALLFIVWSVLYAASFKNNRVSTFNAMIPFFLFEVRLNCGGPP